jgi:hypothetical protein
MESENRMKGIWRLAVSFRYQSSRFKEACKFILKVIAFRFFGRMKISYDQYPIVVLMVCSLPLLLPQFVNGFLLLLVGKFHSAGGSQYPYIGQITSLIITDHHSPARGSASIRFEDDCVVGKRTRGDGEVRI